MSNETDVAVAARRLRSLMQRKGLTAAELARLAETSKQQIGRLRDGNRKITKEWAKRLAPLLNADWLDILGEDEVSPLKTLQNATTVSVGPLTPREPVVKKISHETYRAQIPENFPYNQRLEFDVPVYGTSPYGADGAMYLTSPGSAVEWAPRAPRLAGLENVFAIRITTDKMWPRWAPGDLLYMQRGRPAIDGDYVFLVLGDETLHGEPGSVPLEVGTVKLLVRREGDELELQQHNPPLTIKLPVHRVKEVYRVMTQADILGS